MPLRNSKVSEVSRVSAQVGVTLSLSVARLVIHHDEADAISGSVVEPGERYIYIHEDIYLHVARIGLWMSGLSCRPHLALVRLWGGPPESLWGGA